MTTSALTPDDYARFVEELVSAGAPLLSVGFQGYEVTLPASWPYVEAVFAFAKRCGVDRSFITNGMLLHKVADRVALLDPSSISVSLDGAEPSVNDPLRGLVGAFAATTTSVRRFLACAPHFAERLSVASTLYGERNHTSLLRMPSVLAALGVTRWKLSVELGFDSRGSIHPIESQAVLVSRLVELRDAASRAGVTFELNDEFGLFAESYEETLRPERLFDPDELCRVDPTGTVRIGREILSMWSRSNTRRWRPGIDDAAEVLGFRPTV